MTCSACQHEPAPNCHVCGEPFDGWAISSTTCQCWICGGVYQLEWNECEACYRKRTGDEQP